ncbi:alpha/beta hydrolase fold protein [Bimuria novae-zelandiae CBS 107.79]|uniref:Alpha/beta hydrolase fold protein n=1 Tax=Bimuria novae-zelandiae CBS 107.79 TaxID=1447943 RepID=A0A6A5V7Y5_9PLEO|nr:alpha/beta hydrolase fold protein [Bimuria novae-zelandiae CBS 107.79]
MGIRDLLSYIIPGLAPSEIPVTLRRPNLDRYPTGDEYNHTLTLPGGRKLGYAQYGSSTGKPIFFFHGLPACRIEGAYFHQLGLKYGARIIAPDRPGLGLSSPHPGRKLLDYPKDIESLAQHLELKEYAVMGASGAGPSVLACAYALPPSQLKVASLICCIGPSNVIGHKGGMFAHKLAFPYGWRYTPVPIMSYAMKNIFNGWVGRTDLPIEERVRKMLQPSFLAKHYPKDLEIMKDEDALWTMCTSANKAYGHSFEGASQDGYVTCCSWGFKISDIRKDLPVQMWYGKQDMNVPISHGDYIAAQLGERAEYHVSNDTHTSVFFNQKEEAIKEVLKKF